jgi:hypothetical protein
MRFYSRRKEEKTMLLVALYIFKSLALLPTRLEPILRPLNLQLQRQHCK